MSFHDTAPTDVLDLIDYYRCDMEKWARFKWELNKMARLYQLARQTARGSQWYGGTGWTMATPYITRSSRWVFLP